MSAAGFNYNSEDGGSFSLSTELISSAIDGYFNLSTPTRVSTFGVACPNKGVIRIEGEGEGEGIAEIRYGRAPAGALFLTDSETNLLLASG